MAWDKSDCCMTADGTIWRFRTAQGRDKFMDTTRAVSVDSDNLKGKPTVHSYGVHKRSDYDNRLRTWADCTVPLCPTKSKFKPRVKVIIRKRGRVLCVGKQK